MNLFQHNNNSIEWMSHLDQSFAEVLGARVTSDLILSEKINSLSSSAECSEQTAL
jgi:hypothetical protein